MTLLLQLPPLALLALLTIAPLAAEPSAPAAKVPGVFTSDATGFDTHTYFYDTGKEVVVFDAQFTEPLARKAIEAIRAKTTNPIRYVVVLHPNPDKFNGVGPFRAAGAKIVASKSTASAIPGVHAYKKHYFVNIAKMFAEADYPPEAKVDITFEKELSLPLARNKVVLRELAHTGVSTTQTVAYIPALKALLVGDLVHHAAHAWLEGGIVDGQPRPDLASWKLALGELMAYPHAVVYGGRGTPADVGHAVCEQGLYLDGMKAVVKSYIAGLGDRRSELSGPNAGQHYKALAQLAAEAFPSYTLPYMIEYGVYGYVNTLVK